MSRDDRSLPHALLLLLMMVLLIMTATTMTTTSTSTTTTTSMTTTSLHDSAHDLAQALELAICAMNTVPSFDTGITNPEHPKRSLSSYQLLPKLEAILKTARGQA